MRRRTVLASMGSALLTTGCLGAAGPPGTDGSDPSDGASSTTTDDRTGSNGTSTRNTTDSQSTTDTATAFAGVGCPSFATDPDRTVCSTTAEDPPLLLAPDRPVFEPTVGDGTVETLSITLSNHSDARFDFNPYDWTLERHTDDEWVHVAPEAVPEPITSVPPGEEFTYSLAMTTHPSPGSDDRRPIVQDLDGGVYALAVDGTLQGDTAERVECVAIFAVERGGN